APRARRPAGRNRGGRIEERALQIVRIHPVTRPKAVASVRVPPFSRQTEMPVALNARWAWPSDKRQPERLELAPAERQLFAKEELVELRRRHRGARQHRVDLAAVVDLVLEQMHQHIAGALDLHVIDALDRDD